VGLAGAHAAAYETEGVVIVDPPRKGLDRPLLNRLLQEPPKRLIYLSCGIDALLRESAEIQEKGLLYLTHLSAFNYFPFTQHVETLAVFDRIRRET
jgi:tRNA/tmRNA/rRNA uracil-C5-methylase (TrmA/RlmC/RlmD family)